MPIVHHHLLYQAAVGNGSLGVNSETELREFLKQLLRVVDMECLISPQLKLSDQQAWTGIMGIITSHVAFHFWTIERYVQLDIYSCKPFDREKAIRFLNTFWEAHEPRTLFVDREVGKDFKITS